jgi:predicted HicB family RNase H-like nuclease
MQMSLTVDAIRADLAAVGELGDDTVAEVAERIAAVLARSLPGRLLDLISEVAADVTAELPEGRLEVRVTGDDVDLVYVADEEARVVEAEGELSARITLRLSEGLKSRLEDGAARQGLSVNASIVRALERSTSQRPRPNRGGTRIRGYGST